MGVWFLNYILDEDNKTRYAQISVEELYQVSGYPVTNMGRLPVSKDGRVRLVADPIEIQIQFPETTDIDTIALVGHNLSSSATITIYGGTSYDPTTNLGTVTWRYGTMYKKFSSTQQYRYYKIAIADDANEYGFVSIGYLVMGEVSALTYGYRDYSLENSFNSNKSGMARGDFVSRTLSNVDKMSLVFENKSFSNYSTVRSIFQDSFGSAGLGLFIPNPLEEDVIFGRVGDALSETHTPVIGGSVLSYELPITGEPYSIPNVYKLPVLRVGEPVPDEFVFTRASTAAYKDKNLGIVYAAANEIRNSHYYDVDACGILLETNTHINSCLQSEDFTTTWTKSNANMTVTSNATNEPLATPTGNADKIIEATAGAGSIQHYMQQSFTGLTASVRHSIGVFVKAGERTRCRLELYAASGPHGFYMDVQGLDTATPSVTTAAGIGSGTVIGYDIERYVDGWWRLQISGTASTATAANLICMILNDAGSSTYTGDGASGLYFWGADFGKNNYDFPLSYIPTTTVAVTCEPDALYLLLPGDEKYGPITIYADMVETGWPKYTDNYESIAWLGDVQGGDTGLIRAYHSTVLAMVTDEGTNTAVDTATISAAIGARYEFLGHLQPDGYTRVWRYDSSGSNDGGGSVSAIDWNLLEAYNFEAVSVGYSYAGTAYKGFWLIKALKFYRGNQDINFMRKL